MAHPKATSKHPNRSPIGTRNWTSRQSKSPADFFYDMLTRMLAPSSIEAAQIWGLNAIGALEKIACTHIQRFSAFGESEIVQRHRDLISKALFSGKVQVIDFQESNGSQPITKHLMLAPIFLDQESVGVFELIMNDPPSSTDRQFVERHVVEASQFLSHRAGSPQADSQSASVDENKTTQSSGGDEILKQGSTISPKNIVDDKSRFQHKTGPAQPVEQGLQLDFTNSDQNPDSRDAINFDVESFVLLLHNQNDLAYVAATATTETRRLVGCDRVSLATTNKRTIKIDAVSGQDDLAKKSNIVRAMEQLAGQVIESGREISFDPSDRDVENSTLDWAATYLESSGASWLLAIPLFEPEKIDFDSNVHHSDQVAMGVLILEQFNTQAVPNSETIERLTPHIAQATFHAITQEQVFLLPTRRRVGGWIKKAKLTRAKTAVVLCLATAIALALALIQVPYKVQATGRLMPVQKFRAYAPFDGQVENVLVTSGQAVQHNQPLIQLSSESLKAKHLSLINNLIEKTKLRAAYKSQLNETSEQLSNAASISLNTKIVQLGLEIEGLKRQLTLQQHLLLRSRILSSIDGTVATYQPEDVLAGRPVGRGDLLLEVMNENAEWQLELSLPEKRFGHLMDQMGSSQNSLRVKFVQATSSDHEYDAIVEHVATRVSVTNEGTASISINAAIAPDQPIRKTIGAEVIAKIDCGKRKFGIRLVWRHC